jgi:GNAT superfamily N-acetyltransferase
MDILSIARSEAGSSASGSHSAESPMWLDGGSTTAPEFETALADTEARAEVALLWPELDHVLRSGTRPGYVFATHDPSSRKLLGAAAYVRAFPPEDGVMGIVLRPGSHRASVARALIDQLARHARASGIRTLGLCVGRRDRETMDLLRAADLPLRAYHLTGGYYFELDLVSVYETHAPASSDSSVVREDVCPPTLAAAKTCQSADGHG